MRIVRRALLLTLVAAFGIALLSPLSARSAGRPSDAPHDPLIAHPAVPLQAAERGGVLSARGAAFEPVPNAGTEAVAPRPSNGPAVVPMEATLVIIPAAPAAQASRRAAFSSGGVWDALAQCESSGNWAINTGNGYYGGLQFSLGTWNGYGGAEFAEYPHQATREEQIVVAERLRAARGYQPWPACRAKLGLP
jgi:hypothetical protein